MSNNNIVKNWNQFLNEQNENNKLVRLNFSNKEDYYKAISILLDNNFNKPDSREEGSGYFHPEQRWLLIEFKTKLKDIILPLLKDLKFEVEYKTPTEYKIFNQGGYLD